jgi:hypothetical protein
MLQALRSSLQTELMLSHLLLKLGSNRVQVAQLLQQKRQKKVFL